MGWMALGVPAVPMTSALVVRSAGGAGARGGKGAEQGYEHDKRERTRDAGHLGFIGRSGPEQ